MDERREKCVMVIREGLPQGLAANTAALLGAALGKQNPEMMGEDLPDAAGRLHLGISRLPIPVLRGDGDTLAELREKLFQPEFSGVTAADFSRLAQGCRTYGEYREKLAASDSLGGYLGLVIWGEKKLVNRLTGSLPLL